ncbi:MAG TPA: carboxypeptidase-like regulatory domain-containing protein, partial [Planctomycetota bacterium]|nr:carboxypeptidase-like regulatory domain-containing protein [Planctomycetota bacterium]
TAGEGSELKIGDSILRATDFLTSTTRLSASRYTRFEEVGRTGPDGTCRLPSTGDLTLLATTPRSTSGLVHFTAPAEGARVVLVVRRTATVRGVVVDAAGQPLADATVEAAPPAGAFPQPRRTTTTTGRDGRFALDLDAFGPHDLTARAGDIGSETLRIEASPGTGEDVRIRMLGAVALHGDVRDPRGAPSTDATVYVVRLGADPHADPRAQRFEGTANASGDGSFRILLPAAGEYLVTAQHAQWAHAEAVRVRIDAGRPPEPVRLVLGERAAMAGTVRWIDGFPAAGARVVVRPIAPALPRGVNPGPFVGPTGFADVREDGTYRIEGLQPHVRYRVLCMPDPGRPYVRIERTDVAPSLQDFVLDRALFGDAEVRLMLRSGGQAIGTAHAIVSRRGRDGTWQRGQPTQITFDAGGQAIIGGLERGATYAIELRCEALGRCRTAPFVAGATTDQIVQPVAPGRVEVTVLDSAGRPVLGAKVVLREDAPAGLRPQDSIRTTDVAGRAVWDSVSVLSWTVFAERGEERSEPVAVKVASHKTSRVEITLH